MLDLAIDAPADISTAEATPAAVMLALRVEHLGETYAPPCSRDEGRMAMAEIRATVRGLERTVSRPGLGRRQ